MKNWRHHLARFILKQEPTAENRWELAAAMTLWVYLFLLIVNLVIGRSVGSAMFLHRFDSTGMAVIYIMVGLVVAGLVRYLEQIGRSFSTPKVAFVTLAVAYILTMGTGAFIHAVNPGNNSLLCGLLYLAIESFAFVTTVQFWATANASLSLAQASRLYVFIGTGGIFGSIVGGMLTQLTSRGGVVWAARLIGWIIPVQLAAVVLFGLISKRMQAQSSKRRSQWNLDAAGENVGIGETAKKERLPTNSTASSDSLSRLSKWKLTLPQHPDDEAQSPSARVLEIHFGLVAMMMVFTTTLVDYYYKMFAARNYADNVQSLTWFFGSFYLCVGVTTLVMQLVLTPWILRRGTAFWGLLSNPMALVGLTLLNIFLPGIWTAAAFKLMDSVMTHSVYRSCQEMLFTALPTDWVRRMKSSSDGVFGRYGLLLAGLFLLTISPVVQLWGPHTLLPSILLSLGGWGTAILVLREEYRRQALGSTLQDATADSLGSTLHGAMADSAGNEEDAGIILPFRRAEEVAQKDVA